MCLLLSGRLLWQARADPEQQRVRLCQLWHGVVLKHCLMVLGWQYMQTIANLLGKITSNALVTECITGRGLKIAREAKSA